MGQALNQVCLTPGQHLPAYLPGPPLVSNLTVHAAGIRSNGLEHLCASIPQVHIPDHCKVNKSIIGSQLMLYFSEIETEAERPQSFPQFTQEH